MLYRARFRWPRPRSWGRGGGGAAPSRLPWPPPPSTPRRPPASSFPLAGQQCHHGSSQRLLFSSFFSEITKLIIKDLSKFLFISFSVSGYFYVNLPRNVYLGKVFEYISHSVLSWTTSQTLHPPFDPCTHQLKVTGHSKIKFFVGFPPSIQDFYFKRPSLRQFRFLSQLVSFSIFSIDFADI